MNTRKIMVRPCMVKIWLYCSGVRTWPFGRASCERISSASSPPTRKKKNEVTKYRTPIRLWSTVVIQPQNPAVDVGGRNTDRRRTPTGSSTASAIRRLRSGRPGSLQGLQIPYQRLDLGIAQDRSAGLSARPDLHVVPGLDRLRVAQPVRKV